MTLVAWVGAEPLFLACFGMCALAASLLPSRAPFTFRAPPVYFQVYFYYVAY